MNYATKRLYEAAKVALAALEEQKPYLIYNGDLLGPEVADELESALGYFDAHGATQADEGLGLRP